MFNAFPLAGRAFFTNLDSAGQEVFVAGVELVLIAVVAERWVHHHGRRRFMFSRRSHFVLSDRNTFDRLRNFHNGLRVEYCF